ncbi:MAG TPA: EAL domain-containing protein [Usitatibacter sp.]|nr:EAL domain-containing protein [Usitatibacter sp.]
MTALPMGTAQVPQSALEELVRRALDAARAPVAWISFLEPGCERIKARIGVTFTELAPASSFPLHGEPLTRPLFLEDASAGEWRAHPLVAAGPRARRVAVVPLLSRGQALGTLTVLDPVPGPIDKAMRTALVNLASLALARVEAQRDAAPPPAPEPASPEAAAFAERLEAEARRRRAAEKRLEQERELTEAVLENLSGAFYLVSSDGVILRWNASLARAIGYSDAEIAAMKPTDFISPADRPLVQDAMRDVFERGEEVAVEAEILDRQGNVTPYLLGARPVTLGGRTYMFGVARDITLRHRTEQQAARARERLDLALASSSLALWDWDLATDRVYFNENWSKIVGSPPRESTFPGDEVLAWTHPDDREVLRVSVGNAQKGVSEEFDCEYRVPDAAGEWIWIHSRGKVTQRGEDGRALRMTGTSTNISKRKRAEERAEYLATRDALTGLPNRVLLHDRLEQGIVNAARHHTGFAFMFIDLDRFKTINDSLGHHVGDELLKNVADRLTTCVRASDTVARLGGDEFAVIVENLRDDDHEGARQVADKMIAAMAAPMAIEGHPLNTSCSIGISLFPADGRDSAALMKNADVAMYYAKEKGRNNYQFFSAEMNARAQERLSVESYLRLALRRGELVLHYQPRMSVATGQLVGVEALIRWQHPRRGLLTPDKFIDVAEESGLIVAIGEWVLQTACAQIAAWHRLRPGLRLSVNLSVGQVVDGDRLQAAVAGAMSEAGVDPSMLELELTESHLMRNIDEKVELLNRLGGLGVGIAIDDFGTGYSSLSYLKKLPVDAIKIDGSFVRDIEDDANDEAIIRAILAMAHSLKLLVVAEGVETHAQLEALRHLGCDEYQGYHEAPALPASEFEKRYCRG